MGIISHAYFLHNSIKDIIESWCIKLEYSPDYKQVGVRIREHRLALKLTQEKLAEKADIGLQHMNKIENGHTKPSLPCIISLANALGTTVDNLLMDNVKALQPLIEAEVAAMLKDCTPSEIYVITQTIATLKQSMRARRLVDSTHQ